MHVMNVLSRQRRPLVVALLVSLAGLWICIPLGRAEVGVFFAVGVFISLLNHVLTEVGLARSLDRETGLTRKQFAMSSLVRLAGVSLIALVIVVAFWPAGLGVLFGLALMHLVVLVFTGLPILNEMRKA